MTAPDLVNGCFEFSGSLLQWINVWRIYRDKEVKGVYWPVTFFFAAWGFWNVYYYPHLHQFFSMWGGINLAIANTVWVIIAVRCCRVKGERQ